MSVPLNTSPEALARMRSNLQLLGDPVQFARRYVRARGYHQRARDFDDVLGVAVDCCVKAGLSWIDNGQGVAFTTWCWRYMDREVQRTLRRDSRWTAELDAGERNVLLNRWTYRSSLDAYRQVEDRQVVVDLVERARLSEVQRRAVLMYALHGGSDGPPPRGHAPLGNLGGGSAVFRTARWHLRVQAKRWADRDDEWTRARDRALSAR